MKNIDTFQQFEAKNYTAGDKLKDTRRVGDMVKRSKDDEHLLRLAKTMANSIRSYDKAYNRGKAAEDQNEHDVAKVFFDRAKSLK